MKQTLYVILATSILCLMIAMPAFATKAGEIKDNVYTDTDYKFSFKIPDGWGTDVKSSKSAIRISMTQNSAPVPQQFQSGGKDYAQVPTLSVFVDTTSVTADQFIKNLTDPKFKSEQKKYFMQKLTIISKPFEVQKEKDVTIANAIAKAVEYKQRYTVEINEAGSDKANIVTDYKGGSIFAAVRDGKIYLFHIVYEYQYNAQYMGIFNAVTSSFKLQ